MQPKRREKVRALIFASRNVGEADRIITFFSREYGMLKAVAKGVRRIPSRRGGHLEPGTEVLVILSGSPGHYYIGAVETLEYYTELQSDHHAFQQARNLMMLVTHLLEEGEVHERLYDALAHAWDIWPTLSFSKRVLLEVALSLYVLRRAGVQPQLEACTVCGIRQPTEAVILDATQGGWHCLLCHRKLEGTRHSISPALLKIARFLNASPQSALKLSLSEENSQQLLEAIRYYVGSVIEMPSLIYTHGSRS
jgi:DNA repair protein RecO (recombination protein O)